MEKINYMDVSLLTTAKRCSDDYYQEITDNNKNKNNLLASVKNGRIVAIVFLVLASLLLFFLLDWGLETLFLGPNSTVYVGRAGTSVCYHTSDCITLHSGSKAITKAEALASGKRACMVCHPGVSIIPIVLSLIVVGVLFGIFYYKVIDKNYQKKKDEALSGFSKIEKDINNKYKVKVCELLSDSRIIEEYHLDPSTTFDDGYPVCDDYIVYTTKTTNKYHRKTCRYTSTSRKTHIFYLDKRFLRCELCNPIKICDIPSDLKELCKIRKQFSKLPS